MYDYKEGDEIEIVSNPGYFWDRIKPGMRGVVNYVHSGGALDIGVYIENVHDKYGQHVGVSKLKLIRKVNKEIKKSGFAKFIQRVDSLGT